MGAVLCWKLDAFNQVDEIFRSQVSEHLTCLFQTGIFYQLTQFFQGKKDAGLEAADMLAFATVLSSKINITSLEILKTIGDKKGYVLAQGQ